MYTIREFKTPLTLQKKSARVIFIFGKVRVKCAVYTHLFYPCSFDFRQGYFRARLLN